LGIEACRLETRTDELRFAEVKSIEDGHEFHELSCDRNVRKIKRTPAALELLRPRK
jgi:hypothetical protein